MYFDGYSSDTEDEKKDQQKDQQDDIVLTGSGKPVTPVAPKKSEPQEDIDLKGSGKTVTKPVVAPTVQTPSQVTKPAEKQVLQAPQVRVTKAQPQELKITIPDYIANTRKRLAEAKTPAERENIVRNSTSLLVRKDRLDVDAPELSKALYNTDEQGNSTIKFGIVNDQFPDEPDIAKRFPDGTSVVIPVNLPLSATKDEIKYQMNNLALEKLTSNANVRAAVANQTTFQYNYGTDEKPDWVAPESMAELPLLMDDADNRGLNYQVTPEMIQAIKVGEFLDSIGQPLDNLYGKAKELSDFVGTYFKNMKEATSKWASNGRGLGIGEQLWENEWANIQSYKGGELYSGVMKILGVPEESITDYPRFKTNPEFDTFPAETATYKPEFKNFVGNLSSFVLEPAEAALEKAKRIKDPTITGFLKSLSLFVFGPKAGTWTDVGEYAGQSQAGVRELTAAIVPVVALTGITVATGGGGALAEGAGLLRLATALRFSGHVVNYGYMGWNAYTATQRMDTKSSTALIGGMALGILGQKFGGSKVLSAITEGTKYGRLAPSIVTGGSNAVGAIIVNGAMWDSFKKRDGSGDTDWALAFANILGDAGVFVASDVPAFRKALKSALPVERSVGFNQFVQDTSGNVFGFVKSQNDIVRMIPLTKEQFDATSKVLKENGMEPIVYDEFSPDALSQFRAGLEPNFKETLSKVYFGRDTELQKRILSTGFNGFNKDLTWGETKPIIRKQAPAQDRSMIVLEQLRSGGSLELGKADASFNQTVEKLRGEGLVEIVNGENGALDYVRLTETGKKTVETLHKKAQSSLQKLFDITEQRKKNMDPLTMEDTADWPPKDLEDYRKEAGKGKYVTKYINNDNPVEISPLEFGGMTPAEQKAIGYAVTLGKLQVDGDGFITRPNYESKYTSGGANVRIKFGNSYGDYRNQKLYELGEALNSGDKKRATALRKSLEGQVAGDLDSLAEAVYSGTSIEIGKTADKTGKVQISEYEFDPNVVLNPQVWSDPIEISIDRSGPNPVLAQVTADKRPEAVAEVESKPVEGSTVKSLPSELLIVDAQGRTQRYVKTKGLYHPANANPEMGIPEARMLADVQAGRVKVRIPEGTSTIQVAPKTGQDYVSGLDNFANPSNSKGAAEAVYTDPSKYGSERPWREGERYRFEWNGKEAVVRKNPEVKFTGWTPTEIAQDQTDWIKANSDYMTGKSDKPVNTAKELTPMFNMDLATMSDTEKAARFDASRPWGSERSRFNFNPETKKLEEVTNPNYKDPKDMTQAELEKQYGKLYREWKGATLTDENLSGWLGWKNSTDKVARERWDDMVRNRPEFAEKVNQFEAEMNAYAKDFASAVRSGNEELMAETALRIKSELDARGIDHQMASIYENARSMYASDLYMQNPLIRGVVRKLGLSSLFKFPSLDEEAAFKNRTGKVRVGKKEQIDLSKPIFEDGAGAGYIRSKEDPNKFYVNKAAMDRITRRALDPEKIGVKAGVTVGRADAEKFNFAPEIKKLLENNGTATIVSINPSELSLGTVRIAEAHEKVHQLILDKASTNPELVAMSDMLKKFNVFGDKNFEITRELFKSPELQGLLNYMKEFSESAKYVDSKGNPLIVGQYAEDLRDAKGNYLPVEQIEGRNLGKIAHEILAYGTGLKTIEPLMGQSELLSGRATSFGSRLDATESIFADAYARVLEELTKVHGTEFEKAILALADSPLRKYVKDYKKGKFTAERSIGQLGLKYIESNAGRYPNLDGRLGDAANGGFQSTEGKSARTYEDLALIPRAKYVESIDSLRAGTGPVHLRDDLVLDASHPIFTNSEPSFIDVDGMPFGNEAYINDLAMTRTVHGSGVKDIEKRGGYNLDFIGTGEGNQAFGWGFYNAEADPTGHVYRRIGSRYKDVHLVFDGEPIEMFKGLRRVGERFLRFQDDLDKLQMEADYLRVMRNSTREEFVKEYQDRLNLVSKELLKAKRIPLAERWRQSIEPYLKDLQLDVEDFDREARKSAVSDPDRADSFLRSKKLAEERLKILEKVLNNPEKLTVETGGALYRNLLKPEQHEYFLLDQKFEGQSDFFKQAVNNEVTLPDGTKMKLIDAMNMGGANEVVPYHQYTFSPENQKLVDQLPKLLWIRDLFDRTIITGSYDLPDPAKDIPRILERLDIMRKQLVEGPDGWFTQDNAPQKAQLEAIDKAIAIANKLDPNSNSWVKKMPVDVLSGKRLLEGMETEFGPRNTSMMLLEAGIKGNKFLDGLSRNKGEGTYNYVNFRAEDIQILAIERGVYRMPDFNKNPEGAYRLLSLAMAGLNENFKENLPVDINVNKLADDMDLAMTKSASIRLLDEVNHRYLKDMSTDELQGLAMNRLAELDIRNSVHHPAKIYREMFDVKVNRDAQGNLLAPNGRVSLLPEMQYRKVRTPTFKNWFGDWENDPANASKMVDENGEPLLLWHGSRQDFYQLDPLYSQTGYIYATRDFDWAKPFANNWSEPRDSFIYPLYGNVRNPLDFTELGQGMLSPRDTRLDSLGSYGDVARIYPFDTDNIVNDAYSKTVYGIRRYSVIKGNDFIKQFTNSAFDGIIQLEEGSPNSSRVVATRDSFSFKSAMGDQFGFNADLLAMSPKSRVATEIENVRTEVDSENRLLAPDGSISEMSPLAWKIVRTPSFLDFFGDWRKGEGSLVLDNNGEPWQLGHGNPTIKEGKVYRVGLSSKYDPLKHGPLTTEWEANYPFSRIQEPIVSFYPMSHFGPQKQFDTFTKDSGAYSKFGNPLDEDVLPRGHVYPVFLNIRNPIRLKDFGYGNWDTSDGVKDQILAKHPDDGNEALVSLTEIAVKENRSVLNSDLLKFLGYDGIVYLNRHEELSRPREANDIKWMSEGQFRSKYKAQDAFVALESKTQVKSLFSNAFDTSIDDTLAMSARKTYGGSGEIELTLKRFTPTGNPFDLTGRNGAERRLREGGNPTWNFFAKGADDYVIEPEFAHTTMPFTEITGTFNLLDVSQDAEALKYYRENRFQDFEKWATEKGYDGFYAGHPDIAEWMRMRVALFSNEKNRTTIETAIANGEDALAMTRQRAVDVTYRDPEDHTVSSVKDLLKMGNVSVISGNKLERLTKALDEAGFSYLPVENENFDGVAVYYPFPNTSAIVDYIAMKQGQESVIHSLGGKVTQRYVNGQFKGTEMTSLGTDNSLTIKTSNGSVPLNFYFNHEQRQPFQFRPLIAEQRLKAQKELFGTSIITPADMERIVRGQADYTDSDGNIITMESVRDRGGRIVGIPEYDHKGRMFITVGNEKVTLKNGKGKDKAGNIYHYDKSTRDLTGALGMFQTLMTEWNPRVKGELTPAKKMAVWEKHLHGLLDQWFRDGFRGADWYENEIARYADTVGKSIPDVKADLGQLTLFMLTATTSGGTNVPLNAKVATSIMRPIVHYFETGKLFLPEFQGKIGENGYELLVKDSEPVKYAGSSYQESMSKIEALSRGYIPLKTAEAKRLVKAGATPVGRDEIFGGRFKGGVTKKFVASPQLQADIAEYGVLQGVLHHLLGESETDFNKASEIFGKKYGAFFSNLAGLHNNPTIDSWMVRYFGALTGDAVSVERTRSGKLISVKDNTRKLLKSDGITDMMRAVVQKVSKERGDRNGTELNPAATQAITWTVVKDLFNSLMTKPAPNVGYGEVAQKLKIDYVKSNPDMVKEFTPESPLLKEWVDGTLADGYGSTYYIDQQGDMLAMTPRKAYFADTGKKVDFNEPALASMDPDEWLTLASRTVKGGMLTGAEMDAIRKYADEGDFDRLVETVLNLNRMPMRELFVNVIKANPLTSPAVWYGNILNNITMQAVEEVARLPRFVIDGIGAAFTRELRPSGSYVPFLNEGFARATGSIFKGVKGVPESMAGAGDAIPSRNSGLRQFWDTMVQGDSEIGFEHPYYMRERTTGAGIFGVNLLYPVEWYTKMVFRFQSAMDKPFREFAYTRNMEEIMSTDKRYKGLSREDKIRLFNSSPEDVDRAMTMALYSTFQSDNKIASKLYKWIDSKPPFVKEALQINLPYIKTPSNIFLATLDYAGLGPLLKGAEGAWELKRDKRWSELAGSLTDLYKEEGFRDTLTRALGRGMIGWSMAYIGYALAEKGLVSLDYDSGDNKEQSQDRLRGINPASLTIGKFSIPISRFNPLAFMISAGAIAQNENAEALKSIEKGADPSVANSKERSQAIQKTFFSLMNAFGPLSTAYRTMKDVGAGKFSAAKFLGVDRMVPASGFMGELARTQDDYKRKLDINKMTEWETAKAMWMNKLPKTGLNPEFNRQSLPPQVDMLGRLIPREEGIMEAKSTAGRLFDPLSNATVIKNDAIADAIDKFDLNFNEKPPDGVEYSEGWEAMVDKGQFIEGKFKKTMASPVYEQMDDIGKKRLLKDTLRYFQTEYRKDQRTDEEEDFNQNMIINRVAFQREFAKNPDKYTKSPVQITDKDTLDNINRNKLDVTISGMLKFYQEQAIREKILADNRKEKYEGNTELTDNNKLYAWIGKKFRDYFFAGERKADVATQNYQKFLENPTATMIKWYVNQIASQKDKERTAKYREELKAKGLTEEQITKELRKRAGKLGRQTRIRRKPIVIQP